MKMWPYQKRTWAEVHLYSLQYNFDVIRKAVSTAKICCVIKANGYGHGAVYLAQLYQEYGADFLGVSNIEEALQLRAANIRLPILILGYTDPECAEILAQQDISQCVFSKDYAEALSQNAMAKNVSVKIHVKIDTGMGRLGFNGKISQTQSDREMQEIASIYSLQGLYPEGIFTHFASADEGANGAEYTRKQFNCFCHIVRCLEERGIDVGIRHCANSAATFEYPDMQLDMVRAGIVLYGMKPSAQMNSSFELKPALELKTIVGFIKDVHKGDCLSYGREFVAEKDLRIATLPIGYADGLWRSNLKNNLVVKINGKYAPIVGRICMDQCMIDITDIADVEVGSEVSVYSISGDNSVDNIARNNGTINYEILCAIGERVPRIYIRDKKIIDIQDNIVKGNL